MVRRSRSVVPGTYTATETAKTGWDLTNITCDDSELDRQHRHPHRDLQRRRRRERQVHLHQHPRRGNDRDREADGADGVAGTFDFTSARSSGITRLAGRRRDLDRYVAPGTYTATETAKTGWDLTDI